MSSQIQQCQDKGKIVTISLGGYNAQVGFSSDSQAQAFADNIWDMFLGGSGPTRPLGDVVLNGCVARTLIFFLTSQALTNACSHFQFIYFSVDLDIENGAPGGYAAFVNRLREHEKGGSNPLYITAAPQCPYPDVYIGEALNQASFDAVYVQFCTFLLFVLLAR